MRLEKLQITLKFFGALSRDGRGTVHVPEVSQEDSGRIAVAANLMAPSISSTGILNMAKGLTVSGLAAALALTSLAGASGQTAPGVFACSVAYGRSVASILAGRQTGTSRPPTDAEIAERSKKLLENQHHNDDALEQFERIEHHVDRTGGAAPRVLDDKTYRVVPTGSGTMKLLLKDGERPVDPADYRKQLETWKELLELMLKPEDPRTKSANAKWQKRKADRSEMMDAAVEGFVTKWTGQETRNGRVCDVYELQPNPSFHPRSLAQDVLTRVTAKIWVDRDANQLVRGEAHVMRDISFGGGILGKLYRGAVFYMEQEEIAPGIWQATRFQYDYTARKFLFMFEEHQYVEAREYRHIGPPKQALAMVKNELASGKAAYGDP